MKLSVYVQVSSTFTGGGNDCNTAAAVRSAVNAAAYSKRKAADDPAQPGSKTARQTGASYAHQVAGQGVQGSSRPFAQQNLAPNSQYGSGGGAASSLPGKVGQQRTISDLFTKQTPK